MHGIEESLKLKRTLLLSILAVVPAALMPLAAIGQVAPDRDSKPDKAEPSYKYEVFAGYGYTSLNQVNQSRSGLQGPDVIVTRNWGKYFAITADGAYYKYAYESGNPGTPAGLAMCCWVANTSRAKTLPPKSPLRRGPAADSSTN
jgi:hypothetical protein